MACLVSYNVPEARGPVPALTNPMPVDNRSALPEFCIRNLLISLLLPTIQGSKRLHFVGNWTTPGNGHDLSLLSGLLAANRIGAPYPFANNPGARRDFDKAANMLNQCVLIPFVGQLVGRAVLLAAAAKVFAKYLGGTMWAALLRLLGGWGAVQLLFMLFRR
jgi:hypothetical protein